EPRAELIGRRLPERRDVLEEELHLLRHPALDDRVLLVEAERQRLPVEDLLADAGLDEAPHLLRRRDGTPLRDPTDTDLPQVVRGELDAAGVFRLTGVPVEPLIADEQQNTEQEKMQQRFAEQPSDHAHRSGASSATAGTIS